MGTWKKAENEKGFIYYISDHQNLQQWDHPKFCDVKQAIDDCNYVAYATYRLALKLRVLQRCLYTEDIPLALTTATFERHRLANNENSLTLDTYDLEAVLADIFFAANKQNHMNIDVDFATEIVINFLYNVFDCAREGVMQVVSVKLALGLLCGSSLQQLHKYLFSLCADHNNCITRVRLYGLLQKMHMLMKYLHEDPVFSIKSLNAAVEKCFADFEMLCYWSSSDPNEIVEIQSPGLVGVNECTFTRWINYDVAFLSWLPLVEKLKCAETVIHPMKCTTCKTKPLLGLRYRCVKCPKYTQCQRCFLTGRISHSHKLSHSLREYETVVSKKDSCGMFFNQLYGLFCLNTPKSLYSTVRPSRHFANEGSKPHLSGDAFCDIEPLSSPETQLQGVIRQLESQNRELQQMLIFGNHSDKQMRKYLEEYRLFMAGNIQKLKILKIQINTSAALDVEGRDKRGGLARTQSTPMVFQPNAAMYRKGSLENMSPVTLMTEIEDSIASGNNNRCQTPDFGESRSQFDGPKSPGKLSHNNLDEALARLQQILANNFSLEDSLSQLDNSNLQFAVTEVEGMLTSIIDNVESSRCNSALPGRLKS